MFLRETHEEPNQCRTCKEALTVKHILVYCCNYADTRTALNIPDYLYEALGPIYKNTNKIIIFLKTKPNTPNTYCIPGYV